MINHLINTYIVHDGEIGVNKIIFGKNREKALQRKSFPLPEPLSPS
jgi:hypothetical protein